MTEKELEDLLRGDGWPLDRLDATTWRSGFRAVGAEPFRFFVKLIPSWLCLTIVPFVQLRDVDVDDAKLLRRLLELNREITLAKLALDKRDVILTVELSREGLATSQVKDGLDALVFYANERHKELVALVGGAN
jgi:hypothetical protein